MDVVCCTDKHPGTRRHTPPAAEITYRVDGEKSWYYPQKNRKEENQSTQVGQENCKSKLEQEEVIPKETNHTETEVTGGAANGKDDDGDRQSERSHSG